MPENDYRRNFWVFTADGMLFFLGMIFVSFESVLPVFLTRLNAPRIAIALVPVAIALGQNLPSIFAAPLVEAAPSKRTHVLRFALWQRIPWAVVAVAIPFLAVAYAGWLIALLLLSVMAVTVAAAFVVPAFFDLVARTIPVERRGTLFALRSVLSYLFGIGGGIVVRIVLDRVAFPVNYAILYGIGAVVLFLSLLAFSFIREPAPPPEREIPAPTRGWMRERIVRVVGKNRNFRNYIVARAILIISFGTTSFFPVYLVEEFGLPDSVSGVFAIITAATFVLVNPVFGALGNRSGYKVAFLASFVSLAIASVVGLSGVGVPVAHVLIACTAISQSVNFLAYNMTIEFAGETEIPTYIGVCGFFIGLVAPLAIFTGVIVNAFGFDGLFVLTAATAVAGLLVMAFGVEEPRAALRRLNQPDLPY